MEGSERPYLLLHPAVIPAKWLLLAGVLERLTDEEADRQIEIAEHLAWAAGWLEMEQTPQPRILGAERKPKEKPFVWDEDCLLLNEAIKVARYREMIGDVGPTDQIEIVITKSVEDAHF